MLSIPISKTPVCRNWCSSLVIIPRKLNECTASTILTNHPQISFRMLSYPFFLSYLIVRMTCVYLLPYRFDTVVETINSLILVDRIWCIRLYSAQFYFNWLDMRNADTNFMLGRKAVDLASEWCRNYL